MVKNYRNIHRNPSSTSLLYVSYTTDNDVIIENTKTSLIQTCQQLKDEYGIFLIEKSAKDTLKSALDTFERQATSMTPTKDLMKGEWELLCTTSISNDGIDIPDIFKQGPLKTIRDSIRKTANRYWKVEQHINENVDRIDHVLEYDPPSELKDLIDNLPEQLTSFNINPLQVSKSKLSLVHKASIENEMNPFKIKLSLSKIVFNVAGTSTILDPSGKDIAQIPIPLGEFLNSGDFDTSYVDDNLRISRGKQGFIEEQVRVFIKKGSGRSTPTNDNADFEEYIDPEFDSDIESPSDVEVL